MIVIGLWLGVIFFSALYLMLSMSAERRASHYAEAGVLLLDQGEREKATLAIVSAIAINPYHHAYWAQLSYAAPAYRDQAITHSSTLSRGAMLRRMRAMNALGESALGLEIVTPDESELEDAQ